MNDKQLTPEEILNKHLRTSDNIWELADLKAAVLEYADQHNRNYNESLERVIRQRDALQVLKDEAMQVLTNLDLQEIGKMIGAKLGTDVSTQVRPAIAALQARVQELEVKIDHEHKLCFSYYKSVKENESRIAELERENQEKFVLMADKILLKKENERLMELHKTLFMHDLRGWGIDEWRERAWQSYCREHGLNLPAQTEPPLSSHE